MKDGVRTSSVGVVDGGFERRVARVQVRKEAHGVADVVCAAHLADRVHRQLRDADVGGANAGARREDGPARARATQRRCERGEGQRAGVRREIASRRAMRARAPRTHPMVEPQPMSCRLTNAWTGTPASSARRRRRKAVTLVVAYRWLALLLMTMPPCMAGRWFSSCSAA